MSSAKGVESSRSAAEFTLPEREDWLKRVIWASPPEERTTWTRLPAFREELAATG